MLRSSGNRHERGIIAGHPPCSSTSKLECFMGWSFRMWRRIENRARLGLVLGADARVPTSP